MVRSGQLIFLVAALAAATTSAWTCNATKVTTWMYSCDKVPGNDAKCKDSACHDALHYLVEDMVRDCYVTSGLGPATDLDKYIELDDYCHGETPSPKPVTTTPKPTARPTVRPTTRPVTPKPTPSRTLAPTPRPTTRRPTPSPTPTRRPATPCPVN